MAIAPHCLPAPPSPLGSTPHSSQRSSVEMLGEPCHSLPQNPSRLSQSHIIQNEIQNAYVSYKPLDDPAPGYVPSLISDHCASGSFSSVMLTSLLFLKHSQDISTSGLGTSLSSHFCVTLFITSLRTLFKHYLLKKAFPDALSLKCHLAHHLFSFVSNTYPYLTAYYIFVYFCLPH